MMLKTCLTQFRSLAISPRMTVSSFHEGNELPKRPLGPWMTFLSDYRKKVHGLVPSEVTKQAAEEWRKVGQQQKDVMGEVYLKAKQEWEMQMADMPKEMIMKKKDLRGERESRRKSKDAESELKALLELHEMPKLASRNAFQEFLSEMRKKLAEESVPEKDKLKKMAKVWNDLDEEAKKPYLERSQKDRTKHMEEMKVWKTRMEKEGKMKAVEEAKAKLAAIKKMSKMKTKLISVNKV